jgi:signal peptidase
MPFFVMATRAARRTVDILLIALIAAVLVAVLLARGLPLLTGGTSFVVAGGSMEPTIPMGSVVLATPVAAEQLRPGDVVSLQTGPEHAVFTHRIVRVATLPDGLYVETRGDANPAADPALVATSDVIGRVGFSVPYAGYFVALLASLQGVLFVLSIAALLLVGAWLLESIEEEQRRALRHAATGAAMGIGRDQADVGGAV